MRRRDEDDLPLSRVKPVEEDVRRELEYHIERRTSELVARGVPLDRARAAARELFGDRESVAAECRKIESRRRTAQRRSRRMEALAQDIRLGVRVLGKTPAFTLAATLTLALGIGANTAVFSIVNTVLLRPLPYEHADRLVTMDERHEKGWGNIPWANFLDIEAQARSFMGMASYASWTETVLDDGAATRVRAARISRGFFAVLPIRVTLGRLPAPDEFRQGANPVAVVSYAFWRDRLGAPSRLDAVRLNIDQEYSVVAVMAPGFDFPDGTQIWRPMELQSQSMSRTSHNWDVIARLRPGVTPAVAQREVDAILARLKPLYAPDFDAVGSTVTPLQDAMTGSARKPLFLLLAASAMLLLAACTNLGSATLARGTARSAEMAVRSALGATRTRLVRQMLTEAAILSALGCAAGVALAVLLLRGLEALGPPSLGFQRVHLDGRVLTFAAIVAALTALLFGLLPALRLSEGGTTALLREGSRGTADALRIRAWNVLVAAEVALAVVLLSGSSLLIRSFAHVMESRLGFDPANVLTVTVDLPAVHYADTAATAAAFHGRVLDALRQQPGIDAVGFANLIPLAGAGPSGSLQMADKPFDPARRGANGYAFYRVVGGDFFRAMGIPLVRGRPFGPGDDAAGAPVAIVNETFARDEWPNEDPIGKRLRPAGQDRAEEEPWSTVIGVVGDARIRSVIDPYRATYYFDYRQRPAYRSRAVTYAVRSARDPAALSASVARSIASIDPAVPVETKPASRLLLESVADRRFTMLVLGAFAAVALLLAIIGVYAVVSYAVAQRTREIGVRLALGGTPGGMRRMVIGASMRAVIPGLAVGAAVALASAGAIRSLLYDVSPFDRVALVGAIAALGVAAFVSSLVPALRATRIDPVIAIRAD